MISSGGRMPCAVCVPDTLHGLKPLIHLMQACEIGIITPIPYIWKGNISLFRYYKYFFNICFKKKKNEGESLNELVGHNQTDQYKHYGNYRRRERRKQDIV